MNKYNLNSTDTVRPPLISRFQLDWCNYVEKDMREKEKFLRKVVNGQDGQLDLSHHVVRG